MKSVLLKFFLFFLFCPLFSQAVQSPFEFLGYELGDRLTYHNRVVDYFEHVASVSPNVELEHYGETWEKRPLVAAIVTSAANMENLEDIRLSNLAKAGFVEDKETGRQMPVVWLSYNIHGNEASATEAALKTLYSLVSDKYPEGENWLDHCVVIIDPCLNPDGREKYAMQYHSRAGNRINLDPNSWHRSQPWPGTRVNHYLYDLNRDWPWQTQKETRRRLSFYRQWMPHIHIDFHEMGADRYYFFPPAAKPQHEVITQWQREFQEIFGSRLADNFDSRNELYWTGESFDLLSPSYGDTWPTFNGALGFTFEQGGSGRAGLAVELQTGDTLTLADRIENQYNAGITTVETAFEMRERILEEFNSFFARGENDPPGEYKSYVIRSSNSDGTLEALTSFLDRNGIEYAHPGSAGRTYTGFSYLGNEESRFELDENDVVVSAYQPHSHLVQVFFEPETMHTDTISYDITAWALPYAYNAEAYAVNQRIGVSDKPVEFPFSENEYSGESPYAYIAEWTDMRSVSFLSALLQEEIRVRYATEPFAVNGNDFDRGTIVITRADNSHISGLDSLVVELSNSSSVELFTTSTGMSTKGKDLGSRSFSYIAPPDVMLVGGSGTSSASVGDLWYYFEQVLDYPLTIVEPDNLQSVGLDRYDIVILPAGNYIGEGEMERLIDFARGGGRLIALESALRPFANRNELDFGEAVSRYRDQRQKEEQEWPEDPRDLLIGYNELRTEDLKERTSGSIYRVTLDESSPLAYGIGENWFVQKRNSTVYPYLPRGSWNVGTLRDNSYVSGYVGEKLREEFLHSLVIGNENLGRGDIIYITDSPLFRGYWHSGRMLFGNMLFF